MVGGAIETQAQCVWTTDSRHGKIYHDEMHAKSLILKGENKCGAQNTVQVRTDIVEILFQYS